MNEIKLDFSDRIEKILSWKHWSVGNVEEDFDETKLYTKLFSAIDSNTINVPKSSIFNIFVLLGAKPKRDAQTLRNKYKFMNNTEPNVYKRIDDEEIFQDQVINHMIMFINLSTYIYNRLGYMKKTKLQKVMLKHLIVVASTIYEDLYDTSRGKIAFAYYFKKVLQNSDNLTREITPYNNKSWKSEFAKYIKETKEGISSLLSGSDILEPIFIANVALVMGKMTDIDVTPSERYFIEAGIADLQKQKYNRIFLTTFI